MFAFSSLSIFEPPPSPAAGWVYVTQRSERIETPAQLRVAEIAGNLRRITDQLSAPNLDPRQLHEQLIAAQQDVVASLIDLNAIIGSPAPLPRTTYTPHPASSI
jgi:hypothetical protein